MANDAILILNFLPPPQIPDAYIVKYRKVGTSGYTTVTPYPTSIPVMVTGLETGVAYEGTIQSSCAAGKTSTIVNFTASVPAIPCGQAVNFSGSQGTHTFEVDLGPDSGTVTMSYDAFSIPDRFRMVYNGVEVINTGFRGDSSYNGALATAGYPAVSGGASGTATFSKTSSTTKATIYVDAPLGGTSWSCTVSCPV